ncbi:MAG: hypothetical protein WKG07_44735 [Hymenobacter sp.]
MGRYYKLPAQHRTGVPRQRGHDRLTKTTSTLRSDHYVTGLEWLPAPATRFTLEGFYKKYADYPVTVRDGISLANLGGDFRGHRQRGRDQHRRGAGPTASSSLSAEADPENICRALAHRLPLGVYAARRPVRALGLGFALPGARCCWGVSSARAGKWASSTGPAAARPTRP